MNARVARALWVVAASLLLSACGGDEQRPDAGGTKKPLPQWHYREGHEPKPAPKPMEQAAGAAVTVEALLASRAQENSRCPEGARQHLYVVSGDRLTLSVTAEAALARDDAWDWAHARGARRALPLTSLVQEGQMAGTISLWPSEGEALKLDVKDVRADGRRYALVLTRRRGFKLLDMNARIEGETLLRNLAFVHIEER